MGRLTPGKFITKISLRGTPYRVWEPTVPRIPDVYQECSIYLYPSHDHATRGVNMGGSGFLIGVPAATVPGTFHVFAVTNAHVIDLGSCTVRLNTQDGQFDILDFTEQNWFAHQDGDDLAIAVMPGLDTAKYKFQVVTPEMLLSKKEMKDLNVGPGDEVFVAGRFINSEGRQRNIPTLRFGNVSQMPLEPLEQDRMFNGTRFKQESFLVEARAISGFSGSPVFLLLTRLYSRQGGKWPDNQGQDIIRLLGIVWGYVRNWEPICDKNGAPIRNEWKVSVNTGMMGVVPAWKLQEMLDHPAVKKHMQEAEEAYHRANPPAPTALAESASNS